MKLFIFIPALNEEATIEEVIRGIPRSIPGIQDIEIIVVDDGSGDRTAEFVKKLSSPNVALIHHEKTLGLGRVFHEITELALSRKADIAVVIDGDSQFQSSDIPHLIAPLLAHEADFTSCSRFKEKSLTPDLPWLKNCGNKFMASFLSFFVKQKIYDATCGFRAYNKEALLNLNVFGKFTYTQEVLLDLLFKGIRFKEIPLPVKGKREAGKSTISTNYFRYAFQTLKIIFRTIRDYQPLKFIGGFGIAIFLIGLGADIFVFIHFLKTDTFTPYKSLGFLGGFLMALGVLIFVIGLVADMMLRIRLTQEKILYYEKKRLFE